MYPASLGTSPGHAAVSFQSGQASSGSEIVSVMQPDGYGNGGISFTNNGSATISLAAMVKGYFTDGTGDAPGDTYTGLPWTRLSSSTLAANASMTFDPLGFSGVSQSAVDAVEFQIGTINPSGSGYLQFSGAQGVEPLRSMSYISGEKTRLTDILQPDSNGLITITNDSSYSVPIQVTLRGYFLFPTTVDIAGASYVPLASPVTVCDTRQSSGCSFQESVTYGPIAANSSISIQESGVSGIPTSGVEYVANEINAVSPADTGWLTVDPEGTSTPTTYPVLNFSAGDNGDVAFDDSIVAPTSPSGAITVTNHSGGSVQIVVSASGYWTSATVPASPSLVASEFSNGQADVSWSTPTSDGGSPITAYTVTTSSGYQATTDGGTFGATLSANQGDTVTVTATNLVGQSASSIPIAVNGTGLPNDALASAIVQSYQASVASEQAPSTSPCPGAGNSSEWTGKVTDSNGNSVANSEVDVYYFGDSSTYGQNPNLLGSTLTDGNGCWSVAIPAFSSLTSAEQNDVNSNGGNLNTFVTAVGVAYSNTSNPFTEQSTSAYPEIAFSSGTATYNLSSGSPTNSQISEPVMNQSGVAYSVQALTLTPSVYSIPQISGESSESLSPNAESSAIISDAESMAVTGISTNQFGTYSYDMNNNIPPPPPYNPPDESCTLTESLVPGVDYYQMVPVNQEHAAFGSTGDMTFTSAHTQDVDVAFDFGAGGFSIGGHIKKTWSQSIGTVANSPFNSKPNGYNSRYLLVSERFLESQYGFTCSTPSGTVGTHTGYGLFASDFSTTPANSTVTVENPDPGRPAMVSSKDIANLKVPANYNPQAKNFVMGDGKNWQDVAAQLGWLLDQPGGSGSTGGVPGTGYEITSGSELEWGVQLTAFGITLGSDWSHSSTATQTWLPGTNPNDDYYYWGNTGLISSSTIPKCIYAGTSIPISSN